MLKKYQPLFLILLAYIVVLAFYPSITANFINLDDSVMVTENPYITSLSFDNIKHIFSSSHYKLYHPLVTLSYALEYFVCGLDPYLYHVDNIFLHLFNTLLIFFIIKILSKSFFVSYLTALLFAIHPVCVESVAWISSRKDNLYAFFFLLSILSYLKADDSKQKNILFLSSVFLFLCSCLSKPSAVTLPAILVIMDFFRNKLSLKRIKNYIPFVLISVVFVSIAVLSHYSVEEKAITTLFVRFVNFINAHFNILFYIYKFIFPIKLSCLYPHFYSYHSLTPWYILYSPVLLYLLIFVVLLSLKINKKIFFGFFFFLIALLPSSGVMPTGVAPVADRYAYVAYIGLFYIVAEFVFFIYRKYSNLKYFVLFLSCCLCLFLFYLTYERNLLWSDNKKLMNEAVDYCPDSADHAYLLRGTLYKNEKKYLLAQYDLEKSHSINKENSYTVYHLAHLRQLQNKYDEAMKLYYYVPESSVNFISVINNVCIILEKRDKTDKAIALMEQILNEKIFYIPDYFYHTLSVLYYKKKNIDDTVKYVKLAIERNPYNYIYYNELISLYREKKDFESLEKTALEGLKNTGNNPNIVNELAKEYFSCGKYVEAEKLLIDTDFFNTDNHLGYFFMGNISAIKGEYKKALIYYTMAILNSKKDNGEYYFKRAAVYLVLDKYELAKKDVDVAEKKNFYVEKEFKKDLEKIKKGNKK